MPQASLLHIFLVFLKLGCTSFGGPIAHLGYFRHEFVEKRRWLDDAAYAELVALCQFLPGPASSQLGMALGFGQARLKGALVAWLGFTFPSALLLMLLAFAVAEGFELTPFVAGLKIVAVAVVAQALWGMSRSLVHGLPRLCLLTVAALTSMFVNHSLSQMALIFAAGVAGFIWLKSEKPQTITETQLSTPSRVEHARLAMCCGLLFLLLLMTLPFLAGTSHAWMLIDSFYRAGALVFGGGHVVLPLLETELVNSGLVNKTDFVAAYGAAQAVPGPLFTIASYLGVAAGGSSPFASGLLATAAIFLPGFLLVLAVLPWWQQFRRAPGLQSAVAGINAAVVGILLAAWFDPVLTSAITNWQTAIAAILASIWLLYGRRPVWQLVLLALAISPWLS